MERLKRALMSKDSILPPVKVDEEAKKLYVEALASLQKLADKGWIKVDASDADELLVQHTIEIEWIADIADMYPEDTNILKQALSLDGEACISDEGKFWTVGITIYTHKAN